MEGKTDYKRPSWDDYFLGVMDAIAKRGTCDRGRSGCVIAKNKQIISAGYVGSAAGDDHCDDVGHLFQERLNPDGSVSKHCVRTVHAEQNAICQAARRGIALDGATVYMKMTPCPVCAKLIVNCGIKRVVCKQRYHDGREAERLFQKCGVELLHLTGTEVEYSDKTGFHFGNGPDQISSKCPVEKIHPSAKYELVGNGEITMFAVEGLKLIPGAIARVNTGVKISVGEGREGRIMSMDLNTKGLEVIGGIVASGYDEEIFVPVVNKSASPLEIMAGDKIAKIEISDIKKTQPAKRLENEIEPTPEEITAALDEEKNGNKGRW